MLIYPGDVDLAWGRAHPRFAHSLCASALFADGLVVQDGALWCWGPLFDSVASCAGSDEDHPLLRGMREGVVRLGLRGGGSLLERFNTTAIGSGHQVVPSAAGEPVVRRIAGALAHGERTTGATPIKASSSIVDDLASALLDDFFLSHQDSSEVAGLMFAALKSSRRLRQDDHAPVEGFVRSVLAEIFDLCRAWSGQTNIQSETLGTKYFRRGEVEQVVSRHLCELGLFTARNPDVPIPDFYHELARNSGRDPRILAGLVVLRVISFHYQRFQASHFGASARLFDPTDLGNDAAHMAVQRLLRETPHCTDASTAKAPQKRLLSLVARGLDWDTVIKIRKSDEYRNFMSALEAVTVDGIALEDKSVGAALRGYLEYLQEKKIIADSKTVLEAYFRGEELPYGVTAQTLGILTYLAPVAGFVASVASAGPVVASATAYVSHLASKALFEREFVRARMKVVLDASRLDVVRTRAVEKRKTP